MKGREKTLTVNAPDKHTAKSLITAVHANGQATLFYQNYYISFFVCILRKTRELVHTIINQSLKVKTVRIQNWDQLRKHTL